MKSVKKDSWKLFDDCAICETMEKADQKGIPLSGQELTDAFHAKNKINKNKEMSARKTSGKMPWAKSGKGG